MRLANLFRHGTLGTLARRMAIGGASLACCAPAWAGPEGERVVAGSADFTRNGALTQITAANNTIISYNNFNIGANETVQFIQPDASSRVFNYVTSGNPSEIAGTLIANGIVYIMNQAGVYFAQGATVNVGGIYAGAAHLSNKDFLEGRNNFTNVSGEVINQGVINANLVAMIGRTVINEGTIHAPGGQVVMAVGDDIILGERGGRIFAKVSPGGGGKSEAPTVLEQRGTINAQGGTVTIAAGDMFSAAIRHTGRTRAQRIDIRGDANTQVTISGQVDASNADTGSTGGRVDITGGRVRVQSGVIDASGGAQGGTINVGGEWQGGGDLAHARRTVVSHDSTLRADATDAGGRGGEIAVWSSQVTGFYGTASATGGEGGVGGRIETSSKNALDVRGASVNAGSRNGTAGLWLLDPRNITIVDAGAVGSVNYTDPFFEPTADDTLIDVSTIVSALETGGGAGTDVEIRTFDLGGMQDGNIVVDSAITANTSATRTLTLRAANDIVINQAITGTGAGLNVNLFANDGTGSGGTDDPAASQGNVIVDAVINTGGGNLRLGNTSGTTQAVQVNASIITGAGNVLADAVQVVVTNQITTTTGNIELGDSASTTSTQISTSGAGTLTTGSGNITITATGANPNAISIGAAITSTSGDLTIGTTTGPNINISLPGSINVGTGDILLRTSSASLRTINLNASNIVGASLTMSSNRISLGATGSSQTITTTGDQLFTFVSATPAGTGLTLNSNVTLTSTGMGSLIRFNANGTAATIRAAAGVLTDLIINNANGTVTFDSTVGDTPGVGDAAERVRPTSLSVTAQTINFNTSRVWTSGASAGTGNQTFVGTTAINLNTDVEFRSSFTNNGTFGLVTFNGLLNGSVAGQQSLTVTGNARFMASVGVTTALEFISITGTTAIDTTDIRTTTAGGGTGVQNYLGAVTLGANAALTSGGGGILFDSTLSGTGRDLSLTAGAGNITFTGAVGGGGRLGAISIVSANNLTASQTITAASFTQSAGTGTSTFTGLLNTDSASGISLTGTSFNLNGGATTTNGGALTLVNSGASSLGGTLNLDGALSQSGGGTVTLNGATITTTNDNVTFANAVTLATGATSISTGAGAGDITFSSTVNGAQNLTLAAGTGSITLTGAVGGGTRLSEFLIASANNVSAAAISAATIAQSGVNGTSTFSGLLNTNAAGGINLSGGDLVINGGATTTNGGTFTISNGGVNSSIGAGALNLDGAFIQNGGVVIALNGTSITTTNDAVSFTGAVNLGTAASSIDTGAGAGDITFASTINGGQNLSLTAGTGSIALNAAVGGSTSVGALSLASNTGVTAGAITAASVTQTGTGTGSYGELSTSAAGGVNLAGSTFSLTNATTTNGGTYTLANTGAATFANGATLTLDGAFGQTGAGSVTLNGTTITTTNDNAAFNGAVTLGNATTSINTGAGAGDISFASTVNGAQDLALTAGTGNITFTGAVGGGTRLGALSIFSANNVSAAAITAGSIAQQAGSGTSTFAGLLNTNTASGIFLSGGDFVITGGATTANGGTFTISNSGSNTVIGPGALNLDGAFSQTGAVALTLDNASITTTNDNVSFTGGITLANGATTINTGAGAGDINFGAGSTINGAQNLTLNAGTGSISFGAAVGNTTRIGALSLAGGNVGAGAITAASIAQTTGGGTYTGALNTDTAAGIQLTGGGFSIQGGATTTNNGVFTLTNAGASSIGSTGLNLDGAFSQSGGGTLDLAGASITTTADAISFANAVTLSGGGVSLTSANGDVTFSNTVNGAQVLTIAAGTGAVNLNQAVGGTTALTGLAINSAGVVNILEALSAGNSGVSITNSGLLTIGSGPVTLTGTGTFNQLGAGAVTLNGTSIVTADRLINFTGSVSLATSAVSLDTGSTAGGSIVFNSTVNGAQDLALNAGTGSVSFGGAVGGGTRLGAVVVTSTLNVTGSALTAGSYTQNAGAGVTSFAGAVDLNNGGFSFTGNNLSLTGLTTSAGGLSAANAGTLTLNAGTYTLGGGLSQSGAGAVVLNNAAITTTDAGVSILRNVTLGGGATSLSTGANNITFSGTINGAQSLTLNSTGTTTLTQGAGNTTALGGLSTDAGGTTTLGDAVNTTGAQVYSDNLTLNWTADQTRTFAGGSFDFQGTVNSAAGGSRGLVLNSSGAGNTRFRQNVGLVNALLSIVTNADGTISFGTAGPGTITITTTGVQTYNENATLLQDAVFNTSNNALVTFGGDVNGTNANQESLTINAPASILGSIGNTVPLEFALLNGDITLNQNTTFSGNTLTLRNIIGNGFDLTLNITGDLFLNGSITNVGTLSLDGIGKTFLGEAMGSPVTIQTVMDLNFNEAICLRNDVTLAAPNISFTAAGTIDADGVATRLLTVNSSTSGLTDFGGRIGGMQADLSLVTNADGTTRFGADLDAVNVTTNDAVEIGGAAASTRTFTVSNFTANGTVNSQAGGARGLLVDAASGVTFAQAAGDSAALLELTAQALTGSFGSVTTTGAQTYTLDNALSLNGTYTTTSGAFTVNGAAPTTLAGSTAVVSNGNLISFATAVDGVQNLTLTAGAGNIMLMSAVGATTRLADFVVVSTNAISAGAVRAATITQQSGAGTYSGTLDTSGAGGISLTGSSFNLNGATTTNGGALAVDGDLVLNSAAVNLDGALTQTTGTNVTLGGVTITTTGDNVSFAGNTGLAVNNSSISTAGGGITFNGTIDGARSLTLSAGAGDIFIAGASGGTTRLNTLTIASADDVTTGTLTLGALVQTTATGTSAFGDIDANLNNVVGLNAINLIGTNFVFGSVTTTNGGRFSVNFLTAGGTAFLAQGNTVSLDGNLSTFGPGTFDLNGANITTTNDNVFFGSDVALSNSGSTIDVGSGAITFNGDLDGGQSLMLNSSGLTTISSAGQNTALDSVTTDAGGTLSLGSVRTLNQQSYGESALTILGGTLELVNNAQSITIGGNLDLQGNLTVTTNDGDVTFNGTIDGANALVVNSTANTTFNQAVGGTTRLTSVTTDAGGTLTVGNVSTTGNQVFNDSAVNLNGTYGTMGGNFLITDAGTTQVNLLGATTIDTGSSTTALVTVNAPVDGAQTLTINNAGTATFAGPIGATTALTSLTSNAGGSLNLASVSTVNNQRLNDGVITLNGVYTVTAGAFFVIDPTTTQVFLAGDTTIDTGGNDLGIIEFSSNAPINATTDGGASLTLLNVGLTPNDGGVYIFSIVGGQINGVDHRLSSFTSNAGGEADFSSILTTAGITINDDFLSLGGVYTAGGNFVTSGSTAVNLVDTAIVSGANITFGSTINGNQALTLNSGGATMLQGAVGGNTQLASLTTDTNGTFSAVGISTTGDQTINDVTATLNGVYTANDFTTSANTAVTLGGDVTVNADGITFGSTIDGAQALTLNGSGITTLSGAVGSVSALTSFTSDNAGSITSTDITTVGTQNIGDALITLGGLYTATNGDFTTEMNSVVTLGGDTNITADNITFGSTIDGANALTLQLNGAGIANLNGNVGGVTALSVFTSNSGGTLNANDIRTTFNLSINNDIANLRGTYAAGANSLFSTSASTAVNLQADTTFAGGGITIGSTIDGAQDLTLNSNGDVLLGGAVGGNTALNSLTSSTGGTLTAGDITTTGAQTLNDLVVALGGTYTTTDSAFTITTGTLNLLADTNVSTGTGDVTFGGSVDAATVAGQSLTVNSTGVTTFSGNVGGNIALLDLTTNAGGSTIVVGDVTVDQMAGAITINDALTLGGAVGSSRVFTGNALTFSSTVNSDAGGARGFTLTTPNGGTKTLNGAVGGVNRISRFLTLGNGTLNLGNNISIANGGTANGANAVDIADAIVVTGNSTIDGGNGRLLFRNTINDDGDGMTSSNFTVLTTATAAIQAPVANLGPQVNELRVSPPILFANSIGNANALTAFSVNFDGGGFDGRAASPGLATIVFLDASRFTVNNATNAITLNSAGTPNTNFVIGANTVNFGLNERVVVFGNLVVNAATVANIVDTTSIGDMAFNSPLINLRTRQPSRIFGIDTGGLGTEAPDNAGLSLVSGGTITFSSVPVAVGTGPAPEFATPTGPAGVVGGGAFTARAYFDSAGGGPDALFAEFADPQFMGNFLPLTRRAQGPTNTPVTSTITPFVIVEIPEIQPDTTIGQAERAKLESLGVFVRDLTPAEVIEFLVGRAIYNDRPESTGANEPQRRPLSQGRLSLDILRSVLEKADQLSAREAEFRAALEDVTTLFYTTPEGGPAETDPSAFDPAAFRDMVLAQDGQPSREAFLLLQEMFRQIDQLGLGPVEAALCKERVAGLVAPGNLEVANLVKAVALGVGSVASAASIEPALP